MHPTYTEPWHVIIDALSALQQKIDSGEKPWEGYESCFDFYGFLGEPRESEYLHAMLVAEVYAHNQLSRSVDFPPTA